MNYDLHSHTRCSDGVLSPVELLDRAQERGVDALAITDHDTVAAFEDSSVQDWLASNPLQLIHGIEFSTTWGSVGVHVLGLNIDPYNQAIATGVDQQSAARKERAKMIGEALARKGFDNTLAGASELAGTANIGRVHFARHLVNEGRVASMQDAFKHYLGDGKAGDVRQHWANMSQVIDWIHAAGGIAVLAHPLKYKLTRTRLRRLLTDFKSAGGQGMEVVSGRQLRHFTQSMGELCSDFDLLASCGSDFHQPGPAWSELGSFGSLPRGVTPVWERFSSSERQRAPND